MTDFSKVFNIYSTESGQDEDIQGEQVKRANASKFDILNDLHLINSFPQVSIKIFRRITFG
jgi:hypothetical protein